jgi:hypothetical protein
VGLVRPQGEPYPLLGRGGGEGGGGASGISVKRDEGCREGTDLIQESLEHDQGI